MFHKRTYLSHFVFPLSFSLFFVTLYLSTYYLYPLFLPIYTFRFSPYSLL